MGYRYLSLKEKNLVIVKPWTYAPIDKYDAIVII